MIEVLDNQGHIMPVNMGYLHVEDPRDEDYLYRDHLMRPRMSTSESKYWWQNGWWGNQGSTSECVAYSWAHWLNDGPRLHSVFKSRRPAINTRKLYCEAQQHDPWPGGCENPPHYDGTSVRAGAKVLQDWGYIDKYYWVKNSEEIANAIMNTGPVVVGTMWYDGMSRVNSQGIISVEGGFVGGHAYILNGVNTKARMFRMKNSWGRGWGKAGSAFISMDNMDILLDRFGEACVAIQKASPRE